MTTLSFKEIAYDMRGGIMPGACDIPSGAGHRPKPGNPA